MELFVPVGQGPGRILFKQDMAHFCSLITDGEIPRRMYLFCAVGTGVL